MKCPLCDHVSDKALLQCSACDTVYDRELLERLQHLDYMRARLETADDGLSVAQLRAGVQARWEEARRELGLTGTFQPEATQDAAPPVATPVAEPEPVRPRPATPAPVSEPPAEHPEPAETVESEPATRATRTPAPPARPRLPRIEWTTVGERLRAAAASGALLRGLLYLGAFMIVVSATILVIRFWDRFPALLQLGFVAAVPISFYVAGWAVRSRLALPQAGTALINIGALLVAVDFAAIYQLGNLGGTVNPYTYWFASSLLCTLIYALTIRLLPTEFFGYTLFAGVTSTLVALPAMLNLAPASWVTGVAAAALLVVVALRYLLPGTKRWSGPARAGRRWAHLLFPLSQLAVFLAATTAGPAHLLTFLLATAGYVLLAAVDSRPLTTYGGVASSVAATAILVLILDVPEIWYAAIGAATAIIYLVGGRMAAQKLTEAYPLRQAYLNALTFTGYLLVGMATAGGLATAPYELWPGTVALLLSALTLIGFGYRYDEPLPFLVGTLLFPIPFSLAVYNLLGQVGTANPLRWLPVAWTGLAFLYTAAGLRLRAAPAGGWALHLVAHLLALATVAMMTLIGAQNADNLAGAAPLLALTGPIAFYAMAATLYHRGRPPAVKAMVATLQLPNDRPLFLWPVALLLPVWALAAWQTFAAHIPLSWLGPVWASLALAYLPAGELLARRESAYRLPAQLVAAPLSALAIIQALDNPWALLAALLLTTGMFALLAYLTKQELLTAVAALLFVGAWQRALSLSPLLPHVHALAYLLLAGLGYLPLALALLPRGARHPWRMSLTRPELAEYRHAAVLVGVTYLLALGGVAQSLAASFHLLPDSVPLVRVALPLLAAALFIYGVYRFGLHRFAWIALALLAVGLVETMLVNQIPAAYGAIGWVISL